MKRFIGILLVLAMLLITLSLSGCTSGSRKKYYADKANYVTAAGTVSHIAYDEENEKLFISFAGLNPEFDDNTFKIVGENYKLVKSRGIQEKLADGVTVEFITAPKYFGDGYAMPIVAITVDDQVLLAFDEGYENLLAYFSA